MQTVAISFSWGKNDFSHVTEFVITTRSMFVRAVQSALPTSFIWSRLSRTWSSCPRSVKLFEVEITSRSENSYNFIWFIHIYNIYNVYDDCTNHSIDSSRASCRLILGNRLCNLKSGDTLHLSTEGHGSRGTFIDPSFTIKKSDCQLVLAGGAYCCLDFVS